MILTHPKHGSKFCHSEGEARLDISNGWIAADELPSRASVAIVSVEIIETDDADDEFDQFYQDHSEPQAMQDETTDRVEPVVAVEVPKPIQQHKKRGPKPKHRG